MENFDEVSRRIEWSKNEFSHSLTLRLIPSRLQSGGASGCLSCSMMLGD
jgi:hypothetical protein